METTTAGAGDTAFEPSLWDDFFVSYTPPCSQMSEEWMRERAEELRMEVRRMFEAVNGMSVADLMVLVDALQRLGIDNHYQKEIYTTLSRVHTGELEILRSEELHIVALRFRLLRQHGFFVSTDVFDEFRDGTGNFNTCLTRDPKGLLSLYNAAYLAVPGEDVLDGVIAFTRTHLEAMKGNLTSPIADQICRALDIPLPRYMPQLETMHFITEYEQEDGHNATLLELARLDYCLTRSAQLKELRTFCLWWKDFYKNVNLTYSLDRGVEMYFWGFGVFPGEGNSRARIIFSKIVALISLMDDTFDTHATFEDCKNLDEAIQRSCCSQNITLRRQNGATRSTCRPSKTRLSFPPCRQPFQY
ncbi:hypothetical protein SORBI_3005G130400 [Sorghum bicolor]|uniref:Terpene synthase N-terminal domain-containing protein n=1 Tax=Sorghum bicolor TaxID=4558 RepID=A0A1B6PS63_SORBI|nr:hypothetical protein SORBI_3005G130400 [Sorghum bicolor]